MKEQKVTVQTLEGPMDLFVVFPKIAVTKPHPAVIVLQEAFGVNSHIKDVCRRFAAEGYIAVAPELFHRAGAGIEIGYTEYMAKASPIMKELTNEGLVDDLSSTLNYVKTLENVDKNKIAIIGFCLGGFAAVLSACRLPVAAAISFYGGGINKDRPGMRLTPLLKEFSKIQCPVLLVYGEKDHGITADDVEVTRSAMEAAKRKYDLRVYPGAEHGFFCDERASYSPDAARTSWSETLAWLSTAL